MVHLRGTYYKLSSIICAAFFKRSGGGTPTVNYLLLMLNYNTTYVQETKMRWEVLIKAAIDQASSGLRYHIFLSLCGWPGVIPL